MTHPLPTPSVRDRRTGSVGRVISYLGELTGTWDMRTAHKYLVKVITPQAHHKLGDYVIWRNPTGA
jgi:hypothetical protein